MRVGLIDYGMGNLASVRNALLHIEAPLRIVKTPDDLDQVSHLILPGVGAFARAMQRLRKLGFDQALCEQVTNKGKYILGLCVGMQVLADTGHEFEVCPGLGLIHGQVKKLRLKDPRERLPHMGWNELVIQRPCHLLSEMDQPTVYFVHSYHLEVSDLGDCVATCDYGWGVTAGVQRENIFGVQFHPEKSQHDGLTLLKNFVTLKN